MESLLTRESFLLANLSPNAKVIRQFSHAHNGDAVAIIINPLTNTCTICGEIWHHIRTKPSISHWKGPQKVLGVCHEKKRRLWRQALVCLECCSYLLINSLSITTGGLMSMSQVLLHYYACLCWAVTWCNWLTVASTIEKSVCSFKLNLRSSFPTITSNCPTNFARNSKYDGGRDVRWYCVLTNLTGTTRLVPIDKLTGCQ